MQASILGAMLPGREMGPLGEVALGLGDRHAVDAALIGPTSRSRATCSTEVLMTKASASVTVASSDEAKSLSMTAATPCRTPVRIGHDRDATAPDGDGHEPVAQENALTARSSTILTGRGEGTSRRQPRPASSRMEPAVCSASRRLAVASSRNEPIGFVGLGEGGVVGVDLDLGHDR